MRKIFYLLLLITGFVNAQVIIQTPSVYSVCDNDSQDGIGIFDLTTKNAEILGTNDPNLYSIAFFETELDALNNVNQIISPNNFQSGFNTVFVRVWENANSTNYATTSLNLEVQSLQLVEPNDIVIFETTYDGFATFDLTIRNEQIANGNLASYTFSYFTSLTDAQSNINSLTNLSSYNNTSSYQTIFVRATSIDPTACFSIVELHLVVLDENLRPIIATPSAVNLCDVDNNGELFDLTTKNLEILALNDSSLYTVKYYNTLEEAEMNSLDLIASGIGGFLSQIIYVRVHENANVNNYSITSFNINLDSMPVANAVSNLFVYESPFDGFATFNLTTVNTTLLGNQTGLVSKFYLTQSDAINDVNQISDSTNFLNTINEQYIWVRVFNPSNLTCYQTTSVTSFKLIVVDTNNVVNIPDANFKAAIIATGIDTNNDGNIQQIEALQLINLEIPYYTNFSNAILSYVGLNDFQNLNSFKVTSNNQNTIDFSNLPNLKKIEILGGSPMAFNNFAGTQSIEIVIIQQVTITSLDISSLSNLKTLALKQVGLNSIDLSNNLQLKLLNLENNNLSSINVSPLQNLDTLNINNNNFLNIDISNNTNLLYFYCSFNQFVSLDLMQNTNLKSLECKYNNLNNLNLMQNSNLQSLICDNNNLNSIDISQNINLLLIDCSNNNITNLDFSNNHQLSQIIGYNNSIANVLFSNDYPNLISLALDNNNLTEIYVPELFIFPDPNPYNSYLSLSNNPNLTFISLKSGIKQRLSLHIGMDNLLQYICVDDDDDVFVSTNNQTNTYSIGPYCSFTPGGNYNTITGQVLFDLNNNGCDASDLHQPNIKIDINDGTNQGATFINNSGNYNFYTQAGSFDLTPNVENPTWFTISPTTATIPFANNNNNTSTQNFCISANGIHPDLEIVIAPITPARPGFDAVYQIVYKNKGNQTLSQLNGVNFLYNQNLMDFDSATTTPLAIGSGSLSWSYANLLPFESRSIYVTLNINTPTDINFPVNIGDVLQFTTSILPIAGDENTADNTFLYNQTVVGSYDPNDITCIQGNSVLPSLIGEYLHYVINFENTGTAEAENIVVKATIDTTKFNLNSLQLLNTSHPSYVKITGNIVEFIFENIALDSGGHGNILLKIRSNGTLQSGDNVSNRGDIFFDYNAPIDTGIANTVFQSLNNSAFVKDNSVVIFPNPTQSIINVKSDNSIKSIQLYDVQGRLLQTKLTAETSTSIDISDKSNGIYFLKITSNKGIKVERIVKQ
jgi:Secretion system C-terminal sorting domain